MSAHPRRPGRTTVVVALIVAVAVACLAGAYLLTMSDPSHAHVAADHNAEATLTRRHHRHPGPLRVATTLTISGVTLKVPAGWYVARTRQPTSMESNAIFVASSAPLVRTCEPSCLYPYLQGRAGATTVMWIVQGAPSVPFDFDCRVEGVPAFVSTVVGGRTSTACRPRGLDRGGTLFVAFRPTPHVVIETSVTLRPGRNSAVVAMITTARVAASGPF